MTIIGVTGPDGRLGSQLIYFGCTPLNCDITTATETDVDARRGYSKYGPPIDVTVKEIDPDIIINCAAYTNVDGAESNYVKARSVNTWGLVNLMKVYKKPIIHISTDYVFSGKKGPYREEVVAGRGNPVNDYGWSKFGAEAAVSGIGLNSVWVVRTTGLYGGVSGKSDFVSQVLEKINKRETFFATSELKGNQSYVPHVAEALMEMATNHILLQKNFPKVVHIASEEVVSRFEFAKMIAKEWGSLIVPCKNDSVPGWIAKRPINGGLIVRKAKECGLPIYSIEDGLKEYLDG